jgi:hypothetical protein
MLESRRPMRGVGTRGIGALVAVAAAASCGWPEYAFEPSTTDGDEGGAAGASEPTGGSSGAAPNGGAGAAGFGGSGGAGAPDPCENGRRDGAETGVDCGGGTCPACPPGMPCDAPRDCTNVRCTSKGACELLTCSDRTTNGAETDTDCGGPDCEERCAVGDECGVGTDCRSGLCTTEGRCTEGSCDPTAGPCSAACPCVNGLDCAHHDECASGNCAGGACSEGLRVLSRNDDPNAPGAPSEAILQTFVVENDSPSPVELGELTLRYYFSSDGLGAPTARCDAARATLSEACTGVETRVFGLSPATTFADAFVELAFSDGVELVPAARTSETPVTVEPPGGALYDQTTDYSFDERATLGANSFVTLYRKGVLVWGREP